MTATRPTLDELLATTKPQNATVADADEVMRREMRAATRGLLGGGYIPEFYADVAQDFVTVAEWHAQQVTDDRDRARDLAAALEAECAAKDARIAAAVRILLDAQSYVVSDQMDAFLTDALHELEDQPEAGR